jgi:hypothetical protein
MKIIRTAILVFAAAALGLAQQWEVGGAVGASFVPGVSVSGPAGSATAGFQTGVAGGVWLGQYGSRRIGGEIRYEFMQSNEKLASGGTTATFTGYSHTIHYDVLIQGRRRESQAQLYGLVGGGMRLFQGTGKESAYQPLYQFGYLTRTTQIKPMVDFGAGIKIPLSPRFMLRAEIRDFLTQFPKDIIAPAPGMKFGFMLHDIVPMIGIAYRY